MHKSNEVRWIEWLNLAAFKLKGHTLLQVPGHFHSIRGCCTREEGVPLTLTRAADGGLLCTLHRREIVSKDALDRMQEHSLHGTCFSPAKQHEWMQATAARLHELSVDVRFNSEVAMELRSIACDLSKIATAQMSREKRK